MAAFKTVKTYAFTIGIALLFVFFIIYLIEAISPSPQYEDFCGVENYGMPYKTAPLGREMAVEESRIQEAELFLSRLSTECSQRGGILVNYTYEEDTNYVKSADCSFCNQEWEVAQKEHAFLVFYVTTAAGILALLIGMYALTSIEAISLGFMFGGLILIFYGGIQSFQYFGRIAKVVLLGLGLVLLIWVAYKRLKKD